MDTSAASTLHIELGAHPGLLLPGRARLALPPRDALLLARLALDGPQARPTLAAWLWPQATPAGALANLRQRLKRLQDASGAALLVFDGAQVALARGVGHGLQPVLPSRDAPESWQALLPGLWPAGADEDDSPARAWLEAARGTLRRQRRQLGAARIRQLEEAHDPEAALPLALWLVADDPDDADALRSLMRLHHARGEAGLALQAYQAHARRLQKDSGDEPDALTAALADTIARAATSPSARPPGAGPASWLPVHHPHWALLGRPPQRVQREAAWEHLVALAQAGGTAWLLGPGGVGKTRLAHDFCETQAAPLRLACPPGQQAVPYALLAACVRQRLAQAQALPAGSRAELARLVPGLGTPPAAPLQPLALQQALVGLMAQAPVPDVVWIDDLHHADAASLELLPAVLAGLRCVLLGLRPEQAGAPLQAWLVAGGDGVVRVELGPFGPEGVAELLAQIGLPGMVPADWAPLLWRHTGGHPFLLLETLRLLARGPQPASTEPPERLPSPPRLLELLQQRLGALSVPARRLAEVAALAGEHFQARLATAALQADAQAAGDAWAELQACGYLVTAEFGRGRLHDLVAEAVRGALPAPRAAQLHRQLAIDLKALGHVPAAHLGQHWAQAGEPQRAARLHLRAAAEAQRLSRVSERLEQLDRAAAQWALAHQPARAFDAQAQAAEVRITSQQLQAGLEQAQALLAAAQSPQQRAGAQRLLAMAHTYGYQHEPALRWAAEAHASALALQHTGWQADAAGLAAVAAANLGRRDEAREWLAREQAVPAGDGGWKSEISRRSTRLVVFSSLGQPELAREALEEALQLSDRPEARPEHAAFLANAAALAVQWGLPEMGLQRASQAAMLAHPQAAGGGVITGLNAELHVGLHLMMLGRFREALQRLEGARQRAEEPALRHMLRLLEGHLAWLWVQLGQPARALQLLQAQQADLKPMQHMRRWALRVEVQRLNGIAGPLPPAPAEVPAEAGLATVYQLAVLAGRPAAERAPALQALHGRLQREGLLGGATWVQLQWLEAQAELSAAPPGELAAAVQALWQDVQQRHCLAAYRPELLLRLAALCQTLGHPLAAQPVLQVARQWVQRAAEGLAGTPWHESFLQRNLVNAALLRG
ncbi:MAG: AAA family ATPase [Rubrivivax sp.]|nr:AAA family ATPase [Rubrivivax sp.]